MKPVITILLWLLLAGIAAAQSPPNGVPCNAIGSGGAVTLCKPGFTYGCSATVNNNTILTTDGNRTSIQFQNNGVTPITLTFGDSAVYGVNGWQVLSGGSYLWSNMSQGNTPGRVATTTVSIVSSPGTQNACTFMFTD